MVSLYSNPGCWRRWLTGLWLFLAVCGQLPGAEFAGEGKAWFDRWQVRQAEVRSWTATFEQVRSLAVLKDPLRTPGEVWFVAPDRFRWQVGVPAENWVVREPAGIAIVYPRLKRVERYRLDAARGSGMQAELSAILEAGFPRRQGDLEKGFSVQVGPVQQGIREVRLEPKSTMGRRLVKRITLGIGDQDFGLRFTELLLADGSALRNEFRDARLNPPVDPALFEVPSGPGWEQVEPMKAGGGR